MVRRKCLTLGLAVSLTTIGFALAVPARGLHAAQHHGGGGHHMHGRGGGGAVGGFGGFGVGPIFFAPVFVMGPGMFLSPMPMMMPVGPIMPPPLPGIGAGGGVPMGNIRPRPDKES